MTNNHTISISSLTPVTHENAKLDYHILSLFRKSKQTYKVGRTDGIPTPSPLRFTYEKFEIQSLNASSSPN